MKKRILTNLLVSSIKMADSFPTKVVVLEKVQFLTYKYLSLITLTLQNTLLALSISYSRTRSGAMFTASTAVLSTEIIKFILCLGLVFLEYNGESRKYFQALKSQIVNQPYDTLKVSILAFAYTIQNNLLYVAGTHLDPASYQIAFQLKILTAAIFSVIILKTHLRHTQWIALILLLTGVVLVQLAQTSTNGNSTTSVSQNRLIGFIAAIGSACSSGFAGIYFEKILKNYPVSIWMRNVQLALCSIPIGLITCFAKDSVIIIENGFFYGYDLFVLYLIILQACGGLLVGIVIKYADNLLKGFATSLAIVLSCIVSIFFLEFHLTFQFSLGAIILIFSIFLYGYNPTSNSIIIDKTDDALLIPVSFGNK